MPAFPVGGVVVSLLTPFDERDALQPDLLREEAVSLSRAGIDALCAGGESSELAGSTPDELHQVCEAVASSSDKPLLAGIYADSTIQALELSRAAISGGATALLVAQPHYLFQPAPDGLEELFGALRRDSHCPVLLANTLAAAPIGMPLIQRLADARLIDGIVQGASDEHLLADVLAIEPRLPVLVAVEDLLYLGLLLGAEGVLSSLAAVYPEECVELYSAARSGEHVRARSIHERLLRAWRTLHHPTEFLARLKFASSLEGRAVGVPRRPYNHLPAESREEVHRSLREWAG